MGTEELILSLVVGLGLGLVLALALVLAFEFERSSSTSGDCTWKIERQLQKSREKIYAIHTIPFIRNRYTSGT